LVAGLLEMPAYARGGRVCRRLVSDERDAVAVEVDGIELRQNAVADGLRGDPGAVGHVEDGAAHDDSGAGKEQSTHAPAAMQPRRGVAFPQSRPQESAHDALARGATGAAC